MRSLLSWKGISGGESKKPPRLLSFLYVFATIAFSVYRELAGKVRVVVEGVTAHPGQGRVSPTLLGLIRIRGLEQLEPPVSRLPVSHQPVFKFRPSGISSPRVSLLLAHTSPLSRFHHQIAHKLFTTLMKLSFFKEKRGFYSPDNRLDSMHQEPESKNLPCFGGNRGFTGGCGKDVCISFSSWRGFSVG